MASGNTEDKNVDAGTSNANGNHSPPSGGNALLVLVGLGVAFLLIVALLGVAKVRRQPVHREQSSVRRADLLRRRGRAVHGIRRHRNRKLREVRLDRDCHRLHRQYAGSGASLVSRPDVRRSPASMKCC